MKKIFVFIFISVSIFLLLIFIRPLLSIVGPEMKTLKKANLNLEIEGVFESHIYEMSPDYYYLIVSNGTIEEGYFLSIEKEIISLSPPPDSTTLKHEKTKVRKIVFSGPKFIYDLNTNFIKNENTTIIEVTGMKQSQYFVEKPLILNKTIIIRKDRDGGAAGLKD